LVNGSLRKGRSNRKGVAVYLTLRFGEDRLSFRIAGLTLVDVGVGIRTAYLNWTLKDCSLPEGGWTLNPQIEAAVTVQRQLSDTTHRTHEERERSKSAAEIGGVLSKAAPSVRTKADSERLRAIKSGRTETHEIKDNFKQVLCTVIARGTSSLPSWHLEVPPGHQSLRGTLIDDQRFALAIATGPSPSAQVFLEVPRHGYALKAEGGELAKTPNKWGLTRLLLQKHLLSKPIPIAEISLEEEGQRERPAEVA
jgi:hypothetical protein